MGYDLVIVPGRGRKTGASGWRRLASGAVGKVLQAGLSTPSWETLSLAGDCSGPLGANAVTDLTIASEARGDLLARDATSWGRVAVGGVGGVLRSDGTDPAWRGGGAWPSTWRNQGSATSSTGAHGLTLSAPRVGSDNLRILEQTAPSTPYSVILGIASFGVHSFNFLSAGICLVDSANGRIVTWHWEAARALLAIVHWTSPTAWSADSSSLTSVTRPPRYLRIRDDGVTRYYGWGTDGVNWEELFSTARTTFLTANRVGVVIHPGNSGTTYQHMVNFDHWSAG